MAHRRMNAIGSIMKILWIAKRADAEFCRASGTGMADGADGVTITMLLNQGPAAEAAQGRPHHQSATIAYEHRRLASPGRQKRAGIDPVDHRRGGENKTINLSRKGSLIMRLFLCSAGTHAVGLPGKPRHTRRSRWRSFRNAVTRHIALKSR